MNMNEPSIETPLDSITLIPDFDSMWADPSSAEEPGAALGSFAARAVRTGGDVRGS